MKFAVSCTFHMIDVTDLDSTSLEIVEAEKKEEAALKVMIRDMVGYDLDMWSEGMTSKDYREDEEEEDKEKDISENDLTLSKSDFIKKRESYWRSHIKWDEDPDVEIRGYDFLFMDVDGASSGCFGIKVIPIDACPSIS